MTDLPAAVRELRDPRTIRERCGRILEAGLRGELSHFAVNLPRLHDAARTTAQLTRERHPDLKVPPHSRFGHFDAGGVPRLAGLTAQIADREARERARILTDVVVASVLLDAGAGMAWRYEETATGLHLGRSEGLAVASLAWLEKGGLSSRGRAFEVDAAGLAGASPGELRLAFQVTEDNPLVGVEGRVHLLRALGEALRARPDVFGAQARLGNLVDALWAGARGDVLEAREILALVLDVLGGIWPGRLTLEGHPLGDVWRHPHAGGAGLTRDHVPFHKLSQWLSYSLLHPLEVSGLRVAGLDALTGLAEYRNGGLFVDAGVLVPRREAITREPQPVDGEAVVEWRALTVALLDRIAPLVRAELGVSAEALPLAAVLEGGTWAAGRELAHRRRPDGGPPITVLSDGTVF
jgi:hypothetical protein